MTTQVKTLKQMQAEVIENNIALGWRDKPVSRGEAMCMLHSEVTEMLEAWRDYGFADATGAGVCEDPQHGDSTWDHLCPVTSRPPKPEGVGSEAADVLIRWLDDCDLFGVDISDPGHLPGPEHVDLKGSFPEQLNRLHDLISRASQADTPGQLQVRFGFILAYLRRLCTAHGIDLEAEYERKVAFNRTRPYRHGNKPI
jgi:NTP pyrophosphatase (non-canonical NTP hydrolase)